MIECIGYVSLNLGINKRSVAARASDRVKPLLGRARTRIGIGARRRALLCCERALMMYAGQLHDMRVALRAAGGEWLELGRTAFHYQLSYRYLTTITYAVAAHSHLAASLNANRTPSCKDATLTH